MFPEHSFPLQNAASRSAFCAISEIGPGGGPSLAGYWWVARASANRASSCQISLLREGEDVWSWFQAAETTSKAAVPTEPEADQGLLGPKGRLGLGEN